MAQCLKNAVNILIV